MGVGVVFVAVDVVVVDRFVECSSGCRGVGVDVDFDVVVVSKVVMVVVKVVDVVFVGVG